ncbi:high mobility group B protein 7-like protein [Tanacetum coccineum]
MFRKFRSPCKLMQNHFPMSTIAIEAPTELVFKKPATEKKKSAKAKEPTLKKTKKERDPSKPKRLPTAFVLFMDDFRNEFKEAHPEYKKVSLVAKEGGEKWKSMIDEEKKCYTDRAAELKEVYQKALEENPTKITNDVIEEANYCKIAKS